MEMTGAPPRLSVHWARNLDKISSPFPCESGQFRRRRPCPSQHDSFILVSVLFLDTGVLNLTLHLRRSPSVYFHSFHTVDEARRRRRRNSERELSLGGGSRRGAARRGAAWPDGGWTGKRIEHEQNRESGRVLPLGSSSYLIALLIDSHSLIKFGQPFIRFIVLFAIPWTFPPRLHTTKGQSKLSLRRNCTNESSNPGNLIELSSDDDSIDLPLNLQKNTKEYKNVTSHGTTSILNSVTDASKCNSEHNTSDNLSDDDIIVVDHVSNNDTSYKSQSMFNWNKPISDPLSRNIFPECSSSRKNVIETPNKRRKLMINNSKSSDSSYGEDDFIDFDFPKKDDSPPQVGIHHEIMIAGTRVKLPVKPYPCQLAVMNSLIAGCTKEQNCLLESPTGSGKTLALLCAALAWQEQYKACNFNGICSYMPCDVLTLIMRWGSAFYAEGTNRGTIAENSSQKELADRAVSLLHDLRSRVLFYRYLVPKLFTVFILLYVSTRLARCAREGKGKIGKGEIETWNGSPGMVQGYPQSTLLRHNLSAVTLPTMRRRPPPSSLSSSLPLSRPHIPPRGGGGDVSGVARQRENIHDDDDDAADENFFLNSSQYFDKDLLEKTLSKSKSRKVPKIFYGSRTHGQLQQVVREFKKTAYRYKRMTILSSRKKTCIQETDKNKDKLCNELLDPRKGEKCKYFNRVKKKPTIFNEMDTPWDIEDLVLHGEKTQACPYFGSRTLMTSAEIIFCPYNYILYPEIRESMQIHLRGNIVILDEAHNMEDICREAATVNLRSDKLENAVNECKHLLVLLKNKIRKLENGVNEHLLDLLKYKSDIYTIIHKYLSDLITFLNSIEVKDNDRNEMVSTHWIGSVFRELLDVNNVGCPRFPDVLRASMMAIEDFKQNLKEDDPKKIKPTISQESKRLLEYLCFAMQMITSDKVDDYRMYIIETNEFIEKVNEADDWISSTSRKLTKVRTMTMKCMNPAIVFAPLAHEVRSVILASGTLTPTISFQSELGTKFPHIINPDHIIPKNQLYIRYIAQGPNKKPLKATYAQVNTWDFQDELGNLVLQVCDAVPYGVLCFFSSYKAMTTIHNRWRNNGTWDKLSELKTIFVEPKYERELNPVMKEYRSEIERSSSESYRTACGAIFFAVFRAKVAEGMDFSDNEARCVLSIGIPYLLQSSDISMKMDYNNLKFKESKQLLSGSEWYTVNAFRALNQAIGRCVRHKNDWGAVLLVDKRFEQEQNINYLPKWVKANIKCNQTFDLELELQDFVVLQVARERGEKEELLENNKDFLLE
ncbi:Fanconi anemia group J protein like protein [Cyphomyrmex costatus]|uniref:DNA 5'-3' helicase n=1 Tax=Cyphomyrmex costatus TaxID=456900 RepID=A0A195CM31_9HYME|nr:Fanconi anemia group J protein like protein [Cyphomyrmex costatus]